MTKDSVKDDSTKRFRKASKQSAFRKKSNSKSKKTQHVAHILDLKQVKNISKRSMGKERTEELARVLNTDANFRMVESKTNLVKHKRIDEAITEKIESGEKLTSAEAKRARQQVKFVVKKKKLMPKGFKNAFKKTYSDLRDHNGEKILDARKLK